MKEPKCPHVEVVSRCNPSIPAQSARTWHCKWCGCPFTPVVEPEETGEASR